MAVIDSEVMTTMIGEARVVRDAARRHLGRERRCLRSSSKTRKSAETRRKIMRVASGLMVERGGPDFQMCEVSERCGMSKGALYYYFSDRDELVEAIYAELTGRMVDSLERAAARQPTGVAALRAVCAEFLRCLDADDPLVPAITSDLAYGLPNMLSVTTARLSRLVTLVSSVLARAGDEGAIREVVDYDLAATYLVGGLLLSSLATVARDDPVDREALSDALVRLTMEGIARPRSEGESAARPPVGEVVGEIMSGTARRA